MELYSLSSRMCTQQQTVGRLRISILVLVTTDMLPGLITGLTGAAGDLGGIVFLLIARYSGIDYGRVFWIIGIITIVGNVLVIWIRPIPKSQLGGR